MAVELFDTHIHLDRLPQGTLTAELEQAQRLGVGSFLVPGVSPRDWDTLIHLPSLHPGILLAPGLHPNSAHLWSHEREIKLRQLVTSQHVVALGEIGLDSGLPLPLQIQERAFREQLRLAISVDLPVLLHCRGTLTRVLQIFHEEGGARVGGILHAFSGSPEMSRMALKLNLLLGFGGGITWPEARRGPAVLRSLPETAFVLESDAPDQSPEPHRGVPNRPLWLELVAKRCAEIRHCRYDEIATQTAENARRILRLPT